MSAGSYIQGVFFHWSRPEKYEPGAGYVGNMRFDLDISDLGQISGKRKRRDYLVIFLKSQTPPTPFWKFFTEVYWLCWKF